MFEIVVQDALTVMNKYVVVTGESKGIAYVGDILVDQNNNEYRVAAIPMDNSPGLNSKKAMLAFDATEHTVEDVKGKILKKKVN